MMSYLVLTEAAVYHEISSVIIQVLGSQPNAAEGEFYLDMANWNLQEAVSAWMDVHHPRNNPLAMRFVQVLNIM